MLKLKSFILMLMITLTLNVYAGSKQNCPNLEIGEVPDQSWSMSEQIDGNPEFKKVLISTNCVGGNCTISCRYNQGNSTIALSKVEDVSIGNKLYWNKTNLGGITFYQCMRTVTECYFYQ